jgi:hypothetical protein
MTASQYRQERCVTKGLRLIWADGEEWIFPFEFGWEDFSLKL